MTWKITLHSPESGFSKKTRNFLITCNKKDVSDTLSKHLGDTIKPYSILKLEKYKPQKVTELKEEYY